MTGPFRPPPPYRGMGGCAPDQFDALRGFLREEIASCLGLVPSHYGHRSHGQPQDYSGFAAEVGPSSVSPAAAEHPYILNVRRPEVRDAGAEGLASVHVSESDVNIFNTINSNSRLVLDVMWQSGNGGDGGKTVTVDATRGAFFTLSGSSAIQIRARLESSIEGEPLVVYSTKKVTATVHWGTSINPVKARYSLPSWAVTTAGTSTYRRIPPMADSMIALSDDILAYPALVAEFAADENAATRVLFRVPAPLLNGSPIVHGAEFVRFRNPDVDSNITAVFELKL